MEAFPYKALMLPKIATTLTAKTIDVLKGTKMDNLNKNLKLQIPLV